MEDLEKLRDTEMFGLKDLRDLAKSLKIIVTDLDNLCQSVQKSEHGIRNGKRIINLLLFWILNKKVQTIGPREIILEHFIVQLFTGILLIDSERINELVDAIPLYLSFKVLLSLKRLEIKQEISTILTELLQREFGISSLIQVFPRERIEILAKLINSVPKNREKMEYYRNISDQIFMLISDREVDLEKAHICAEIIILIVENSQKEDLKKVFIDFMQYPFQLISSTLLNFENVEDKGTDLDGNMILVTEEELEKVLIQMQLILNNLKGKKKILEELVKGFRGLFYLFQYCFDSKVGIKNILEELVASFLEVEEIRKKCTRAICFKPVLRNRVNIIYGSNGGLALSKGVENEMELDVGVFMTVLQKIQDKSTVSQLMLDLLEFNFCLQDVEATVDPRERILIFNLILAIMDEYGVEIIQNFSHLLSLVKSIIMSEDAEVVPFGLTLLAAVLGSDDLKLATSNTAELEELSVLLDEYKENDQMADLAGEVRHLIVSKLKDDYMSNYNKSNSNDSSNAKFKEAIKSLADPLLPIRAFGLSTLRSLVLSGDAIVTERLDLILNIFLEQLADEDSFIYLNSVKGLSALTDKFPIQSLNGIVSRYKDSQNFSLDYRLRIGETLMQTIQRSGNTFAKYGTPILESILKVLHDEKKEMRASAMSCLATISQEAPLTLLPIIYQVMQYFINLLAFEDSVELRRGAVFNFACLIKGLDESFFTQLPGDIIASIQRQLEYIEATDHDPFTKSHARDAISQVYMLAPFLLK